MQPETIEIARSSKVCTVCYRVFQGYKSGAYCCMDCRAVGYNRKRQQRAVKLKNRKWIRK
jgi:hypothetical protein